MLNQQYLLASRQHCPFNFFDGRGGCCSLSRCPCQLFISSVPNSGNIFSLFVFCHLVVILHSLSKYVFGSILQTAPGIEDTAESRTAIAFGLSPEILAGEQTLRKDIIQQWAPRRKRKQSRGRRDASRGLFSAMVREADGLSWHLNQDLNEEREWGAGRERVRQKNSQWKGPGARVAW